MDMDEPELLMQRFVDNDLTAEERIRLLRMLDQDKALRRHLLDTEALIADAAHLPRFVPPIGFRGQVCDRLAVRQPSIMTRARILLTEPHVFRWNVAGALAAGLLLLAVAWFWVSHWPGR